MSKFKVVHYINQFFAQVGGEEMAHIQPEKREGPVGPGLALSKTFGDDAEIVSTIVCGDSWFNENLELARKTVVDMVREDDPDIFIAGPAFNAGRYGVACGSIAEAVKTELGIPVVTGMYIENPGADMLRQKVYIIEANNSAAVMGKAAPKMAKLALKLARGE